MMPYFIAYPGSVQMFPRRRDADRAARAVVRGNHAGNELETRQVYVYYATLVETWEPGDFTPDGGQEPPVEQKERKVG